MEILFVPKSFSVLHSSYNITRFEVQWGFHDVRHTWSFCKEWCCVADFGGQRRHDNRIYLCRSIPIYCQLHHNCWSSRSCLIVAHNLNKSKGCVFGELIVVFLVFFSSQNYFRRHITTYSLRFRCPISFVLLFTETQAWIGRRDKVHLLQSLHFCLKTVSKKHF